ncbi:MULTISPECIES: hypothetical protein [unclassified Streptomyces]|uniref:hypothetical protein n=1 Tax=unclassified Streptomyces TaxID=2593676 RepID=UPI0038263AE3
METTTQTATDSEQAARAAEYGERMVRAASDYVELVRRYQDTEREQTEPAAVHATAGARGRAASSARCRRPAPSSPYPKSTPTARPATS